MLEPQGRVGGYPKYTDGSSTPLLVIFDDSLHNHWSHEKLDFQSGGRSWSHVPLELDAAVDVGRLRGGQRVPCGQSIRATFKQSASMLTLRASTPMAVANATAPLLLSLAFTLAATASRPARQCEPTPTRGWCNGTACVSLRPRGTKLTDTVFVPLCGARQGPKVNVVTHAVTNVAAAFQATAFMPGEELGRELGRRWQEMEVPLELFGHHALL